MCDFEEMQQVCNKIGTSAQLSVCLASSKAEVVAASSSVRVACGRGGTQDCAELTDDKLLQRPEEYKVGCRQTNASSIPTRVCIIMLCVCMHAVIMQIVR